MQLSAFYQKQKIMDRVLLSLIPLLIFAVWSFGWRTLILLAVVCLTGCLVEYASMRLINGKNAKVSEAALVSCFLFTLSLPPATPYWVAMLGIAFGLFFGKGVFGGFGRNVFNPALVARCFVYISFPNYLTVRWTQPFLALPGGFYRYDGGVDAITAATPMIEKGTGLETAGYGSMFLGLIPGSMGEISTLLILAAAIYLIVTKTASWKIMLSCTLAFSVLNTLLYLTGAIQADPLFSLLAGGFMFAVVFMTTDPVSAPGQEKAKWLYGALIGILAVVIRNYSLFTEGIMFAILIANAFAPLIDRQIKALAARKKVTA